MKRFIQGSRSVSGSKLCWGTFVILLRTAQSAAKSRHSQLFPAIHSKAEDERLRTLCLHGDAVLSWLERIAGSDLNGALAVFRKRHLQLAGLQIAFLAQPHVVDAAD